jgi:membrane-bound lytic murein transglycosylase A
MRLSRLGLALLTALLTGCAAQEAGEPATMAERTLTPVAFTALPGWRGNPDMLPALESLQRGCRVIAVMPEDQKLGGAGLAARLGGQAGQWRGVCAAARAVPPGDSTAAAGFFEAYFVPYRVSMTTKFSGYFEPVYDGSETRLPGYEVPVYGKPRDLVSVAAGKFGDPAGQPMVGRLRYQKLVPYYSRAAIMDGAISGQAPVVAWLRSPIDAYMMQIQGAGRLRLPDGSMIELRFDGTNGRPYVPIGKLMVARGLLPPGDVSARTISAWLKAHPAQVPSLMDANPNYVFFKRVYDVPPHLGAPGALDAPLTPGASIAVAGTAIPLGTPVYVSVAGGPAVGLIQRVMVAQDIDAGAHGLDAAEIFTGIGRTAAGEAAAIAGPGQIYVLLPRPIQPARTASVHSPSAMKAMP